MWRFFMYNGSIPGFFGKTGFFDKNFDTESNIGLPESPKSETQLGGKRVRETTFPKQNPTQLTPEQEVAIRLPSIFDAKGSSHKKLKVLPSLAELSSEQHNDQENARSINRSTLVK